MKFPSFAELDTEQQRIFTDAPTDNNMVVIGAPGTGKTIMAIHRAMKLTELGQTVSVIMYNRVLVRYTSSGASKVDTLTVSTMNKWIDTWWTSISCFSEPHAPTIEGDKWTHDWQTILKRIVQIKDKVQLQEVSWGHLLIDEGQDFPDEMYFYLSQISIHLKAHNITSLITVFVDDNQRLEINKTSTIDQIVASLGIRKDSNSQKFKLTKNFRNTLEIAKFAQTFEVGNQSGLSELPKTRGDKPRVIMSDSYDKILDFTIRKINSSLGLQIGIITEGTTKDVAKIYYSLNKKLHKSITLQAYIYNDKKFSDQALDFESKNTVTILHKMSAKGTEFDLVFYLGLESQNIQTTEGINEKMSLYVMSSRARAELFILLASIAVNEPPPDFLYLFPKLKADLCRYIGLGDLRGQENSIIQH